MFNLLLFEAYPGSHTHMHTQGWVANAVYDFKLLLKEFFQKYGGKEKKNKIRQSFNLWHRYFKGWLKKEKKWKETGILTVHVKYLINY